MAALSNQAILDALRTGRLTISPEPEYTTNGADARFESDAVNLTLAPTLQILRSGVTFDPSRERITDVLRTNTDEVILDEDHPYTVAPGTCLLAMTAERITLPSDVGKKQKPLMGLVEGRSTLGRAFLTVHVTAPFIHNGTDHQIALEITNLGCWNVVLRKGMIIAQISFVELIGQPNRRHGQFHGQSVPSGARR